MSTARNAAKRRKLAHKRAVARIDELETKAKEQQSLLGELTMRLEGAGGTSEETRELRSKTAAARELVEERDRRIAELSSKISDLEIQVKTLHALKSEPKEAPEADNAIADQSPKLLEFLESSLSAFDSDNETDIESLKRCLEETFSDADGLEVALTAIACGMAGTRNELEAERLRADEAEAALAEVESTGHETEKDSPDIEALEKRTRDAETASKALAAARDEALAEVERLKVELEKAAEPADEKEVGDETEAAEVDGLKEELADLSERLRAAEEARDEAVAEVERLKVELAATEADSSLSSGQEQLQQALADAQREMQNATDRANNLQTMLEAERGKYQQLYQKSFPLPSQEGVQFGAEVVGDGGKKGFFSKKKPFVIEAFCYHKDGRISVMNSDGEQLPINQEKWNDN